jgi:hypothetical protein
MRLKPNNGKMLVVGECVWAGISLVLAALISATTVLPQQVYIRDYAVLFLMVNASVHLIFFALARSMIVGDRK